MTQYVRQRLVADFTGIADNNALQLTCADINVRKHDAEISGDSWKYAAPVSVQRRSYDIPATPN